MIRTEADYLNALTMAETLMDATPGSPEEEMLSLLVDDIVAYEDIHYPIEPPDPDEAMEFRIEQGFEYPPSVEDA